MMFCPGCGKEAGDITKVRFCPSCGMNFSEITGKKPEPIEIIADSEKTNKTTIISSKTNSSNIWIGAIVGFVAIVVVIMLVISSGGSFGGITENKYVSMVKNGHPEAYPSTTYGKAFDSFFSDPNWTYFESDNHEKVVEFTGYCTYQGATVLAKMQFVVTSDNSFEARYLEFNGVPQMNMIMWAVIQKAFEG